MCKGKNAWAINKNKMNGKSSPSSEGTNLDFKMYAEVYSILHTIDHLNQRNYYNVIITWTNNK